MTICVLLYQTNGTGCASFTFSTSVFFNSTFENNLQDSLLVNVNVTEEGTGEGFFFLFFYFFLPPMRQVYMLIWCLPVYHFTFIPDMVVSKSTTVSITFEVGKVTFVDLPEFFDSASAINGKASESFTCYRSCLIGSLS